ncbi:hypothetical protein MFLO_11899 [Listeria floridensis FSL S10-1187]|uniref:Cyclic nucleotide-binding domain-containing protein n=2 Tax=Listeria floridensis TaxID=1494962 RepID=A0ABN0RDD0_9LIST|nr:hypothetical protein MFLO_11899 [Listeria floridensis FSL S10-1187]
MEAIIEKQEIIPNKDNFFYVVRDGVVALEFVENKQILSLFGNMQGFCYCEGSVAKFRALTDVALLGIEKDFLIDHFYVQPEFFARLVDIQFRFHNYLVFLTHLHSLDVSERITQMLSFLTQVLG